MIIKRNKLFASPQQNSFTPSPDQNNVQQQVTSRDLQIENMKLQRQMMINNRMKQKLQQDERNSQMKNLAKLQQNEAKKDQVEKNNQVQMQKAQQQNQLTPAERNWNSIRQKSKVTAPVPMKN